MNYDEVILDHYKSVAASDGKFSTSTMKDEHIRKAETDVIENFLNESIKGKDHRGITIADIGCGNGYTLSKVSEKFPGQTFVGYEYTPELYELARERFVGVDNVSVYKGDIRECFDKTNGYDICYTQRVLINLLDKNDQCNAIGNIVDAARAGADLLFVESFQFGLDELNSARKEFMLDPIESAHHNLLLDQEFFDWLKQKNLSINDTVKNNFLSSYYYVARVLHPHLLGDIKFTRNSHFVKFLSSLINENFGQYSPVQAYAFRK